ncbi:pentatricopeptide repeat-containing protein [Cocos nucifera]|uniref:Pentatricopeptide repeat-containing protein n=1 Tax=Cocos nucifera TaxID=13894 RepID=A0A8K0I8N4_COCNU|nr:pentatricopeptide repeat-containing protein [Cocos nucifera]
MWRRLPLLFPAPKLFSSSSSPEIPTLYSFLQPSIFALRKTNPDPPPPPPLPPSQTPNPQTLTPDASALESDLQSSLQSGHTDRAWSSFKALSSRSLLPSPSVANSLLAHLSSLPDRHNLKRAFASAVFLLERNPQSLSFDTLEAVFRAMDSAATPAPAVALVRTMFKNRFFPPFSIWGQSLIQLTRRNGGFAAFLRIFEENCRLALDEKIESMKPDISACNAVLDGCCRDLGSVSDAERVLETMSALGLSPDLQSFGSLAYLYAWKGLQSRIAELDKLMDALGFLNKMVFFKNLVGGFMKSSNLESVSLVILRALKERNDNNSNFLDEETYVEVVKGFVDNGRIKDLAALIIEAQELESSQRLVGVDSSVGFGIINACVGLGLLNKAHNILDEMNARGASVGLGVYSSILKAYCKEQRTAEAAQLVTEISSSGLQLDASSYDALIDASMSAQDFQSAFSLFRDMREARLPELKTSYLTMMTGLMENHRPELMAAFLDSVVEDPRIEIATHDWNSIIHAFCKVGRFEDARRTYRRMLFLRFEPNNQTYLSLINGYVSAEKYYSVLILWTEVRRKGVINFDHDLVDAFLFALVKGGFFDAAMQVVEKAQELKIFVDKWRHKQAFMEKHKKLKVAKLRKRNFRKMEALIAFKNWAGLNA